MKMELYLLRHADADTIAETDDARPTLWVLLKVADGLGVSLSEYLKKSGNKK